MKLRIFQLVETSTHGARALDEALQRLCERHELVKACKFAQAPGPSGGELVRVEVTFTPKPSMTVDEARRWFGDKVRGWCTGVRIYDITEVTALEDK